MRPYKHSDVNVAELRGSLAQRSQSLSKRGAKTPNADLPPPSVPLRSPAYGEPDAGRAFLLLQVQPK